MLLNARIRLLMAVATTIVALTACNPITLTPNESGGFTATYSGPWGPGGPYLEVQVPELSPEDNMGVIAFAEYPGGWETFPVTSDGYHSTDILVADGADVYVWLSCEDDANNEVPCQTPMIVRMRTVAGGTLVGDLTELRNAAPVGTASHATAQGGRQAE
jgi:hypothetical protein